ncbi:hypothetical protein [Kitasatospora sp. NPDC004272]
MTTTSVFNPPLEPVGDDLAAALVQQGAGGVRALGLLRDAYRLLHDQGYERGAELADIAVRTASDCLLSLGTANKEARGLRAAATGMNKTLKSILTKRLVAPGAASASVPVKLTVEQVRQLVAARQRLVDEVNNPGGYHRERALIQLRQVLGQAAGTAQRNAADGWGGGYGAASKTVHGSEAGLEDVAGRYRDLLELASGLFIQLPARAERIRQLAVLEDPTADDALEVARWQDPRGTAYFFTKAPSPRWLQLLTEELLRPDPILEAPAWPALPYLDHLTATATAEVTAWLDERFAEIAPVRAEALDGLLRLAARPGVDLTARIAPLLQSWTRADAEAVPPWTQRLAGEWALSVPIGEREGTWLAAVAALVTLAVRADFSPVSPEDEDELEGGQAEVIGLPQWHVAQLLREVVRSAAHADAEVTYEQVRIALVELLKDDLQRLVASLPPAVAADPVLVSEAVRQIFYGDMAAMKVGDAFAYLASTLARALLDLLNEAAHTGVPLQDRIAVLEEAADVDRQLSLRFQAAHLLDCDRSTVQWRERATALVPSLIVQRPAPEPVTLVCALLDVAGHDDQLLVEEALLAALGQVPVVEDVTEALAALKPGSFLPDQWMAAVDWAGTLPGAWLEVWRPVVAAVTAAFGKEPAGVGGFTPFRVQDVPVPVPLSDLALEVATSGAPAAATKVRAAAGTDLTAVSPYALVLRRLLAIDPTEWTTDPLAVVAALDAPGLSAAYLEAAANNVEAGLDMASLPQTELLQAALKVSRALADGEPASDSAAADTALVALSEAAVRCSTALNEGLSQRLLEMAGDVDTLPADVVPVLPALRNRQRAVRLLLGSLADAEAAEELLLRLDGAVVKDPADPRVAHALPLALPDLFVRHPQWTLERRVALLVLRPGSAADLWLRFGPAHPPLLAELDRDELVDALSTGRPSEAATHVAIALLSDPQCLGPLQDLLPRVAAGSSGVAAVSRVFSRIAGLLTHVPPDAADGYVAAAEAVWRAALDTSLPAGSLAGSGAFARYSRWPDASWLELTAASAGAPLECPEVVAARAARFPDNPTALRLMTQLVARPGRDAWADIEVRRHAVDLLKACGADVPEVTMLRDALINSGVIDAHDWGPM